MGLPNAGKSTFLAAVSRARPKIAEYPFTTLFPNLGVAAVGDEELVIADIPGLIEGAHSGAGWATGFSAISSAAGCCFTSSTELKRMWRRPTGPVRAELQAYGHGLAAKPEIVCLNKVDALGQDERARQHACLAAASGSPVHLLSGAAGEGVRDVLAAALGAVRAHDRRDTA